MPSHGYVMISEGDSFFINNDLDGNLTAGGKGWMAQATAQCTVS